MNRSTIALIVVAVLLGGAYVCFFSDWFTSPRIQIIPQIRPIRSARSAEAVYPVSFTLDGKYKLTSVKVVEVSKLLTNKFTPPAWYLTTKSNSLPIQGIIYGTPIRGLNPSIPNAKPEPLKPDVTYRLFVESGRAKGTVDFKTRGANEPPQ